MKLCRPEGVCLRCWEWRSHPTTPPLLWQRDVCTGLTLCLQLPGVTSGSQHMAPTMNRVGSGDQQPTSRCQVILDLMKAVGRVCPISLPSLPGHFWPWWVCLGWESSAFLFTPVLLCAYLFLCPLYGDSCPVRGRSILMSSLDLHQLCEDLSFVCKVTPRYLGLGLQNLTLRGHDGNPHTLQRL